MTKKQKNTTANVAKALAQRPDPKWALALSLADIMDIQELDISPLFYSKGKRKGFLRDRVNRNEWCDHQRAAWFFLAANANPLKYSEKVIGGLMFETDTTRAAYLACERVLQRMVKMGKTAFPNALKALCKDRVTLEEMGVY